MKKQEVIEEINEWNGNGPVLFAYIEENNDSIRVVTHGSGRYICAMMAMILKNMAETVSEGLKMPSEECVSVLLAELTSDTFKAIKMEDKSDAIN